MSFDAYRNTILSHANRLGHILCDLLEADRDDSLNREEHIQLNELGCNVAATLLTGGEVC